MVSHPFWNDDFAFNSFVMKNLRTAHPLSPLNRGIYKGQGVGGGGNAYSTCARFREKYTNTGTPDRISPQPHIEFRRFSWNV